MCGRYTLTVQLDAFTGKLAVRYALEQRQPKFNICPSQPVVAILNDGKLEVTTAKWGLIPSWARDPSMGNNLANARAEGIESKPSFRNSFKRRRAGPTNVEAARFNPFQG